MTKEKKKMIRGLVLRICLCLVLGLLLWDLLAVFLDQASEGVWEKDTGRMVSICDRYYYDRNYSDLREQLELFDLYGTEFGKYWEAVEGYQDYLNVLQWTRAEEMGLPQSQGQAVFWRQKLESLARQPEYAENQGIFRSLVEQLP